MNLQVYRIIKFKNIIHALGMENLNEFVATYKRSLISQIM